MAALLALLGSAGAVAAQSGGAASAGGAPAARESGAVTTGGAKAGDASAATTKATTTATVTRAGSTDPNEATFAEERDKAPAGHRLTAAQAERIALKDPKFQRNRREHRGSTIQIYLKGQTRWQLSLFPPKDEPRIELAQVIVDDGTARITESWDGVYVPWTMARGYDGAFGRSITNPWVWGVLLILFLLPLVRARPLRLPPLPILVLGAFTAPFVAFNNARLDWAVPLSAALLLALVVWGLTKALRRREHAPPALAMWMPAVGLGVLAVGLLVFRAVLNVTDGNVIDVGYASVVGADLIGKGDPVYGAGTFPSNVATGDTYGPFTYLAYLPWEQIFPWSGSWDDLPAAHASALAIDALAAVLLFFVGRRQEQDRRVGNRRGVLYAYLWLACPWTAYVLNSNSNDALVAVAMGLLLIVAARPVGRGLAAGLAVGAKIAPAVALPVLATRRGVAATVRHHHGRPDLHPGRIALVLGAAVLLILVGTLLALQGESLRTAFDRIIGYQAGRKAPFMPVGWYEASDTIRLIVRVGVVVVGVLVALLPRRHDLTGTAAAVLALLALIQLATEYWIYLYLAWLVPVLFVATFGDRELRWPEGRAATAVTPRVLGPLPEEDAPWAAEARRDAAGTSSSPGSDESPRA
ncbi:MAG: glycosyltransferase family 87 protein [Solirubrobacteraceae bacterium]